MKAVMLSIQPKWCELIASGKKTVEVRKTAPKLETPFKVYMYCTKPPRSELFHHGCIYEYAHELIRLQDGSIVYDYGMRLACEDGEYSRDNFLCQKVIGEFVCYKVEQFTVGSLRCDDIEKLACLSYREMLDYFYKPNELDGKTVKFGYGWHISDLKIYDTPKELREFFSKGECRRESCAGCRNFHRGEGWLDGSYCDEDSCIEWGIKPLTRPPQSWCYVEGLSE